MVISIPVTAEVFSFCRQEFGGQAITINEHNKHAISNRISELLVIPENYRPFMSSAHYTHKLSCQLGSTYAHSNCIHLEPESVDKINLFVHDYIRLKLFDMLDILLAVKPINIGLTIEQYLMQYKIYDCVNTETLKKAYYRHRQRPAFRHVPYIAAMC
jgi:hypothetical protein